MPAITLGGIAVLEHKTPRMQYRFRDPEYETLNDFDGPHTARWAKGIVDRYRERILLIKNAKDERDFYAAKSLHFERLDGNRLHQHSMRLNIQWRLILELDKDGSATVVEIIKIEDYHK